MAAAHLLSGGFPLGGLVAANEVIDRDDLVAVLLLRCFRVFTNRSPQGGIKRQVPDQSPEASQGRGLDLFAEVEAVVVLKVGLDRVPAVG
jgi:hypothetical protein